MDGACPLPSPEEALGGAILARIRDGLLDKVHAALREAAKQARDEIAATGLDLPPPAEEYFTSVVHQELFFKLCGADPETFAGGKPEVAIAIIRNNQSIARHYWGATIELTPRHKP